MIVVSEFPSNVTVIEHEWITLSDGVRLAAKVWLPDDAEANPVPAILEYLPYRLADGTTERDALQHPYFAGHGYAAVRVDMRGSGNSDGILEDEYLKQEQDDGLEILSWIAAQPWCDGDVGIIGISWGGFNGLQIAARRPPELKAVITLCSTDDRYADDVHYIGGCLNAADQLSWASTMLLYNAKPPLPWVVGEDWKASWLERLDRTPSWIEAWMTHQHRDEYWKHGSICEDYASIECPVFAVGGWSDGYTNAVFRMLANLDCPRRGLIGPWAHAYPEIATPGPRIGFLQECLRWWDRWLKDIDTGVESDPMLRVWMPDALEPAPHYESWPGSWVAESNWPSATIVPRILYFNNIQMLDTDPSPPHLFDVPGSLRHGKHAGHWCPYGVPGDFPGDQREEDSLCLTFETKPVNESTSILGFPELDLRLSSDTDQALIAARLCDVWPDGRSTLISRGLLNLSHRESHEHPQPLEPGKPCNIAMKLNAVAWSLPAGHRLRLSLASNYWPWAWPSSQIAGIKIHAGDCSRLSLPIRQTPDDVESPINFDPPETAQPEPVELIVSPARDWRIISNPINGDQVISVSDRQRKRMVSQNLEIWTANGVEWTIQTDDPLTATNIVENSWRARRDDWDVEVRTRSSLTADSNYFHLTTLVEAFENDVRVGVKTHSSRIARENV